MIKMQDDLKQEPVQESRSVQVDDKKFVRKLMFKISSLVIVHIILQRKLLTDIPIKQLYYNCALALPYCAFWWLLIAVYALFSDSFIIYELISKDEW